MTKYNWVHAEFEHRRRCSRTPAAPGEGEGIVIASGTAPEIHERVAEEFRASAVALRIYAQSLGVDAATADDAVAEAFAVVLAFAPERLSAIQNLRAYLYTTTRNVVRRSQLNGSRVVTTSDEHLDRASPDIADGIAGRATLDLARHALAALEEKPRALLVAILVEQRSVAEVAKSLGTSPSNVSTMLHRARAALREEYATAYVELNPPACGMDAALLARVATGRAARRDVVKYRRHAAGCDDCVSKERSLGDELRRGSLLAILLLALTSGGVLARPETATALTAGVGAARARRALRATLATVGAALAVSAMGVALLNLPTALSGGDAADDGGTHQHEPGRESSGDRPPVGIHVDPTEITLPMPAPGEEARWSARVASTSAEEVALFIEVVSTGEPAIEEPTLQFLRDDAPLGGPVRASRARGSLAAGTLAPGADVMIGGIATRERDDTDQRLSTTLTVRIWASRADEHTPAAGAWTTAPTAGALAETGATPLALAPGALLLIALGAGIRGRARRGRLAPGRLL